MCGSAIMNLQLLDTMPKLLFNEIDKQRHKISITTYFDIVAGFINLFVVVQDSKKIYSIEDCLPNQIKLLSLFGIIIVRPQLIGQDF